MDWSCFDCYGTDRLDRLDRSCFECYRTDRLDRLDWSCFECYGTDWLDGTDRYGRFCFLNRSDRTNWLDRTFCDWTYWSGINECYLTDRIIFLYWF